MHSLTIPRGDLCQEYEVAAQLNAKLELAFKKQVVELRSRLGARQDVSDRRHDESDARHDGSDARQDAFDARGLAEQEK